MDRLQHYAHQLGVAGEAQGSLRLGYVPAAVVPAPHHVAHPVHRDEDET